MTADDVDQPGYEVYALRYASHDGRVSHENFLGQDPLHAVDMPLDFFFWLIRGHGRRILVDTGCSPEAAKRRGRHYHVHPLDLLRDLDVSATEVTDVILTHLHYDHAGNLAAFPNALVHMQEAEMHYCTGREMGLGLLRKHYDAVDVAAAIRCLYNGQVCFANGERELAPGISVHLCGGHTRGLQFVSVSTLRGTIVLASDAAHFYQNIRLQHPFPIVVDVAAMMAGYRQITARAIDLDHVIPGHDPLVLTAFPRFRGSAHIVRVDLAPIVSPVFQADGRGGADA